MGYNAIVALLLLAGAFGIGYAAIDHFSSEPDRTEQATIAAPGANDDETADPASRPAMTGSAARRMDDFGAGPSGVTVTVPLKDRHRQAFAGKGAAGGGPARTADSAPSEPRLEIATLTPDASADGTADASPSFRVIERDSAEPASPDEGDEATGVPPTFDIVRVDPEGNTVMAGRAEPLAEVEIKAGDDVIDRVTATAAGEWVSTPLEPLSSGDQELSLTTRTDAGETVDSREIVVVSIPETPAEAEPEQPVAVVVDKDEGGEGRILQAPDKLESPGDDRLALKLVDYDDEGAVRLSGEAPPGVPVRIYVDNQPAALVIGDSKGYWITTLDQDLPGGDYTLRLDQLDVKGQTIARLETPFTRVETPPAEGEAKVDYVVVQPGNSLWRIARRLSGDGFNYVYIFEANQAQIRDPDIIYPGQVFEVPAGVDLSAAPSESG